MNFSSKKTEHNQVVVKEPEVGLPLLETQLAAAKKDALELSVKLRAIEKSKNKEIHDLNNSYSWRITSPMRAVLSSLQKGLKLVGLTEASIGEVGGVKGLFVGLARVFGRDGWRGVSEGFTTLRSLDTGPYSSIDQAVNPEIDPTIPLSAGYQLDTATQDRCLIPKVAFDDVNEGFTPFRANSQVDPMVRLIAFYLPQFHPFPQNDLWWGKGFTEWSNVGKAVPNYEGHYQPHCPIHLGYYDLRVPDTMEAQSELAKQYGISGFNYYFYWFGGTILMDSPLEAMLKNPAVDMPFCLTWANENWTRAWDGAENDILIAQEHSASDSRAFIFHLLRYFEDERYIKIEGKPVLCVYRVDIIPDILETVALWREEMRNAGFPGIYLICAQTFGVVSPLGFDFDAAMEFPPHTIKSAEYQRHYEFTNCDFQGKIYNYDEVVRNSISSEEPEFKFFRTAMLAWDNTARKQNNPHIFEHFSLLRYKQWLSHLANRIYNNSKYVADEKIVFVNAWNEWAEGTHLEPDRKYGYGYLQATYDVIANYDRNVVGDLISSDKLGTLNNKYAVIVHIHYQDLWPEIRDIVRNIQAFGCDIYVSTTDSKMINEIRHSFPNACITIVENRGRDILPFLSVFEEAYTLGYRAVCKLHSKQSSYREDGNEIRKVLFDRLAGSESCVEEILSRFDSDPKLGILVPTGYLIPHTDHNMTYDKELVKELEGLLDFEFHYSAFPAGSMFWFRPEALASVRSIKNDVFPVEDGLADGTMAHAMERSFCVLATSAGFSVDSC